MFGAIEAGGTKIVCAVSDEELNIVEKSTFPTTNPEETFAEVFKLFDKYELDAIGIGSFGPIGVNKERDDYGYITSTPKRLWRNVDVLSVFKERYNIPVGWNTDVNAAALGEATLGAGKGMKSVVYITVGTGIGGGVVMDGEPVTGYSHAEMGHFHVPRHPNDTFQGFCDYHGDCLEGLAAGPAIERRYHVKAEQLPADHEAWDIEAHYLAHAALAITMTLSPECIVFGGGVMQQEHLLDLVRGKFVELLSEYLDLPPVDEYLVPTGLGQESGIMGSLLLARDFSE